MPKCQNTKNKIKEFITTNQVQNLLFFLLIYVDAKAILIFLAHNQNGE